jgi:hypothetical protein
MEDQKRDASDQPDAISRKRPPQTAGPHAAPELMDYEKTPGSGMLPEPDDPNISPTG